MQIAISARSLIAPLFWALALAAAAGCEAEPKAAAAAPAPSATASAARQPAPAADVEIGEISTVMNPSMDGNVDAFWKSATPRGLRLSGEGPEQIVCRAKGGKRVGAFEVRLFKPPAQADMSTSMIGGLAFAGKKRFVHAEREGGFLVLYERSEEMLGEKLARLTLTGKRTIHILFTGEVLACE